jgi:hypothetical protein
MDEEAETDVEWRDDEAADTQLPTLEKWAVALRVMAGLWWVLGVVVLILRVSALVELQPNLPGTVPSVMVAIELLGIAFFSALGGMLLCAASHVIVSVGEIEENTLILVEALDEDDGDDENESESDKD